MIATHSGAMQHNPMAYGQPMGPGHGPGPGQHIGQPIQVHPGMVGPNGPHASQAGSMMAAGMQAGAGPGPGGPNAHALSHLTPQAQMFQQHANMQQASKYANSVELFFPYPSIVISFCLP